MITRLIAFREFFDNLISTRFTISFIVFVFMIPFTILINIGKYRDNMNVYQSDVKNAEYTLEDVKTYSMYRPEVIKPPEPMSIFCEGISPNVGNKITIRLDEIPMFMEGEGKSLNNPLLSAFFNMDFITVLSIFLSLFAFVLSYDAITQEKEMGTLRLMLTNQFSRSNVIVGKFVGIILTVMPLLLFSYVLSVVLVTIAPDISYTISEWWKVGLLFMYSILYFGVFALIGLLVSSKFKSSYMSMFTCLFVWIFLLFIIPNLGVYIAETFVKPKEDFTLKYEMEKLEEAHTKYYDSREYILTKAKEMGVDLSLLSYGGKLGGINGTYWFIKTSKNTIDLMLQVTRESTNDLFKIADQKWKYQKAVLDFCDRQLNVSRYISMISPGSLFKEVAADLCSTNARSYKSFVEKVRLYRDVFIKYIKNNKLLDSYSYITPIPQKYLYTPDQIVQRASTGKYKTYAEAIANNNGGLVTTLFRNDLFPELKSFQEYSPIDVSYFPSFNDYQKPKVHGISEEFIMTNLLIIVAILLYFLVFISFARYDVR